MVDFKIKNAFLEENKRCLSFSIFDTILMSLIFLLLFSTCLALNVMVDFIGPDPPATQGIIMANTSNCYSYNNFDNPLAYNYVSVGAEATDTSRIGAWIKFVGSGEVSIIQFSTVLSVHVAHASWPTYPDAGFNIEAYLTFYNVSFNATGSVYAGPVLFNTIANFTLPWRPPNNGSCVSNSTWMDPNGICRTGITAVITFNFTAPVTLPNQIIWGVGFDTDDQPAENSTFGPWGAVNYALQVLNTTTGTDMTPYYLFINSTSVNGYSDNGAGGLGTWRIDTQSDGFNTFAQFVNTSCLVVSTTSPILTTGQFTWKQDKAAELSITISVTIGVPLLILFIWGIIIYVRQ